MSQRALNSRYFEMSQTQINAASTPTLAFQLLNFEKFSKFNFIDNDSDAVLRFYLVHPFADETVVANRLLWFELGGERVLNYSLNANVWYEIPSGTKLFVASTSASTNGGKLRIAIW